MTQSKKGASNDRLAAIASEFEMEDLEEEMSAATPEERIEIIEREGSTREQTLAARARIRAKLEKKIEELEKAADEAPPEIQTAKPASTQKPPPERSNVIELSSRRRIVRWAAGSGVAGVLAAAAAFFLYLQATAQEVTPIKPASTITSSGGPGTLDLTDPLIMRYEGMSYCADHAYALCFEWLDKAERKDPGGERAWPRAAIAREKALQDLASQQRDH